MFDLQKLSREAKHQYAQVCAEQDNADERNVEAADIALDVDWLSNKKVRTNYMRKWFAYFKYFGADDATAFAGAFANRYKRISG